ncbi:MAG TPA: 16S rRNA (uracil(1498)-N(3))-methyltransferase [Candidatus Lumbricidophila sp.]|nr:16S rRNA (uracil(1498)-N(3))-methyltransferase [Candidatus Lumbricidophila sp.]
MSNQYLVAAGSLADAAVGDRVHLDGDEARHAVTVARVRVGERLAFSDGAGAVVHGVVAETGPRSVALTVDEHTFEPEPSVRLTLVQALAKGDRDELAVQAATELGVDAIVPWAAARSVSRWEGAKLERGRERWATIVREGVKQSLRAWVPAVQPLATTAQLVERLAGQRILVLEPSASSRLAELVPDGRDIALVVGPEGGIAADELTRLATAGAELVRLGTSVLRTSTAGPAAIAALSTALQRW